MIFLGLLIILGVAILSSTARPATAAAAGTRTSVQDAASDTTPSTVPTFTVVIDAGHQSVVDRRKEPLGPGSSRRVAAVKVGTRGYATKVPEYRRTLEVALRLRDMLEAAGIRVVMVRTTSDVDITNRQRALLGNDEKADLVVRLHCDGYPSHGVHGITTLAPAKNRWTGPIVARSLTAAARIRKAVIAATGARDRGISRRSDLVGFNWSKVPTVLVEMGFMSNAAEDRRMGTASYQDRMARGLAAGVSSYLAR